MAAVTKLGLLLIVLISGIHGEENFDQIRKKGDVYTFHPPKEANFCVISRSIGEENLVLWNTSDLSPENLTLPEDLKKRLEVSYELYMEVSEMMYISSYKIHNLTHSDSGLYREECWTDGNVTHQWNTSITVCSTRDERDVMSSARRVIDIPCKREREGDNLTVQWFRRDYYRWTRMFLDHNRSLNLLMKDLEGRVQLVENSPSLRIYNFTRRDVRHYTCLVMEKQQCVSSNFIYVYPQTEFILQSIGEEAVLPCFDTDLYGPPAYWWRTNDENMFLVPPSQNISEGFGNLTDREQQYRYSNDPVVNKDFSLVFSSLTLNHSGYYECYDKENTLEYVLLVCPESEPLTQFFSDGEEVTLSCNSNTTEFEEFIWVRNTEQEKSVILYPTDDPFLNNENTELYEGLKDRLNVSSSGTTVVLLNLSAEDSGEYWCVVHEDMSCKLTTKTILIYKHPFGIDSTFYAVWSSLMSCGLLGMVCAVVTVNVKYRRREQVPVI